MAALVIVAGVAVAGAGDVVVLHEAAELLVAGAEPHGVVRGVAPRPSSSRIGMPASSWRVVRRICWSRRI